MRLFKYVSLILILNFISCSKNEINKNPYLHEVSFEKVINLNLPQYDNLNFNGGALYLNSGGIKGLILFNSILKPIEFKMGTYPYILKPSSPMLIMDFMI